MKLTRVRLEQFRQFRQPLEITGLAEGLNLFTGPNEAGKSTVVAAIRAAFFERHRSSSVDDLRPWGDAAATPSVELDFTLRGTPCRLAKSFLGRKRCSLQVGSQQWEGAQAEDHLAELLGFQYAGKGASAAQHWGIPGLLWIQQGSGHELHDAVAHATDHLRSALQQTLGEVAGSGGDALLAQVQTRRNELLTSANATPRGPYAEALKCVAQLEAALQASDAEVAAYRQRVDQLATLRREHAADEADRPWAALRAQEQAARETLQGIQAQQAALAAARTRAAQLAQQVKLLRQQVQAFAEQETGAARRAADEAAARQALQAAAAMAQPWALQAERAATACEAARERLRLAREQHSRRALQRERDELARQAAAAAQLLQQAEAAQAAGQALQAEASASALDPALLQRLRGQRQALRELQIQREAAATRLRFELSDGAAVLIAGQPVQGSGQRLLLGPTAVDLGSWGRLEIAPGGTDLATLGEREAALRDEHAAALQQAGLADLDAAEARQARHAQALAELKTATATLKALAPAGVQALREAVQAQAQRARELEAALHAPAAPQPVPGQPAPQPGPPAEPATEPAVPGVAEAEAVEEAARLSLEEASAGLQAARLAAGSAQAGLDNAQREHHAAAAVLQAPGRAERVAAAAQALADALADEAALQVSVQALSDALALARPELVQQDITRLAGSALNLEQAFAARKTALLRLEVALEGAGALGLDEQRAGIERELAQARRRADELRRRAAAADHLLGLLQARRSALMRELQAPLQRHLQHYLPLLFGPASVALQPDLGPAALTREGPSGAHSSPFQALSFGAREQLGLISRLAYADLLREAGRPTLIILDDALVHSDTERLAQMKRILFDAATRHQVLLFTCHPAHWRDLGAPARELATLRGA